MFRLGLRLPGKWAIPQLHNGHRLSPWRGDEWDLTAISSLFGSNRSHLHASCHRTASQVRSYTASPALILIPTKPATTNTSVLAKNPPLTAPELFKRFEGHFPEAWHADKWYLTAIGSLIGSNIASLCGDLYTYLIAQPQYSTSPQRQQLVRRMREAMIKCIILNGIPVVFEAVLSIAAREQEADKDYSFSREGWLPDKANEERGLKVLRFLYRDDHPRIMERFHAHKDLPFLSTEISYGLFLADHTILDLASSQLVSLPAIMCQNLAGPTGWHLRGCLRAGISLQDTTRIQECIEMIARYADRPIDKVGSAKDVTDEMYNL